MMRTEIPAQIVRKIARLTDMNQHSDSIVMLLNFLDSEGLDVYDEILDMEQIMVEHDRIGHLPRGLSEERSDILHYALSLVEEYYSNIDEVTMAF